MVKQFYIYLNVNHFYLTHRTLSGDSTSSQSKPRRNVIEGILHIPQNFKTEASLSNHLVLLSRHSLVKGFLPFCRDAVGVFYNPTHKAG